MLGTGRLQARQRPEPGGLRSALPHRGTRRRLQLQGAGWGPKWRARSLRRRPSHEEGAGVRSCHQRPGAATAPCWVAMHSSGTMEWAGAFLSRGFVMSAQL